MHLFVPRLIPFLFIKYAIFQYSFYIVCYISNKILIPVLVFLKIQTISSKLHITMLRLRYIELISIILIISLLPPLYES